MAHRIAEPFRAWHYRWLLDEGQAAEGMYPFQVSDEVMRQLVGQNSWSCLVDERPVACGGTVLQWPGRHLAWAYLARGTLPHITWLTKVAHEQLAAVKGRLEFTVRADFAAGHRWAKMLGFEVETPRLVAYGPSGEDHVGYVKVNR